MILHRLPCTALLLLALVGCEDDSGADDDGCTYSGSLSGDLSSALPGSDGVVCVTQFSSDEGIDVEYVSIAEPTVRVDLVIDAVTRGMTGDGFPTEVRVLNDALDAWASLDCTVDISEHTLVGPVEFGESWRVRGAGRCAAPLARDGGGSITLTPFEFAATVTWTD